MITPYAMDAIKKRFYQFSVHSKGMKETTQERVQEIKDDLEVYKEKFLADIKVTTPLYKLDRYFNALRYIDGKKGYTFDDKMVFIINLVDPECIMLKAYRALDLMNSADIDAIEDQKEQTQARLRNEVTMDEFQRTVRSELGFYEARLLKFEEQYYKRFVKEFIPLSGKDFGNTLFTCDYDFSKMTPASYLRVKAKVDEYLSKVDKIDTKTVIYHALFQNNLLRLYTNEEKLLFFILVIDPDLNYLNIYDDECMWDKIEARIREELGYFNKDLITVESNYCRVFGLESKRKNLW